MIQSRAFSFIFKEIIPGRMGVCPVEIRQQDSGRVLAILTEPRDTGSASVREGFPRIATQLCRKHLRGLDPERITWVLKTDDDSGTGYQRITLVWDGERYECAREM